MLHSVGLSVESYARDRGFSNQRRTRGEPALLPVSVRPPCTLHAYPEQVFGWNSAASGNLRWLAPPRPREQSPTADLRYHS